MTYAGRAYGEVCRAPSLCRVPHRIGKRGRTWRSGRKVDRSKRSDGTHREPHEIRNFRQYNRRDTKKQVYLANRGSDSAHHCGCGGRAAVGSGSGHPHGPVFFMAASKNIRSCCKIPHANRFSSRRIMLICIIAALLAVNRSSSRLWRRSLSNHANVRSTAQRQGTP